ncbi:general substrate transporter [Tricholoma matsutake]|nr:general substrate transporter [Tricholoma matsutake 945]
MTRSKDDSRSSIAKTIPEHIETLPSPKTPQERQIALKAALEVDPGVTTFSWRAFQMYFVTLVACCCSGDNGFDGTVMGGVNGMLQYQHYFGLSGAGVGTSGTIPSAYLPDRFGRRFSMFFGNAAVITGVIITATATSMPRFLGGRFLTGFGTLCAATSAKSFLAELVPPQSRGAYLGFLNSFYYVGQIAATGMMVPTGRWQSELSWRLPLWIQIVPASLNVLLVFLCPESPRWLHSIGKSKEARAILARFHSSTGDINSPLIDLEMEEIEEKIRIDGVDKVWWDFRPLFRTRADRYRAYMVVLIGQLSGNGLITYFLPILLQNAGIKSQNRRLTLNFVNSGSFLVDRFGRRKNLLMATSMLVVTLAIVSGLLSSVGSIPRANAGISFIYLFMVIFSFGWTPMQALYPAEVLSYEMRAKGLAFLGIITQLASLVNTFGLPVALQRIGWKVYIIFCIWDVFEVVMIYFFVVETRGFTLEEINEIFEHPNPPSYIHACDYRDGQTKTIVQSNQ